MLLAALIALNGGVILPFMSAVLKDQVNQGRMPEPEANNKERLHE
jgi:hypothetical protein